MSRRRNRVARTKVSLALSEVGQLRHELGVILDALEKGDEAQVVLGERTLKIMRMHLSAVAQDRRMNLKWLPSPQSKFARFAVIARHKPELPPCDRPIVVSRRPMLPSPKPSVRPGLPTGWIQIVSGGAPGLGRRS